MRSLPPFRPALLPLLSVITSGFAACDSPRIRQDLALYEDLGANAGGGGGGPSGTGGDLTDSGFGADRDARPGAADADRPVADARLEFDRSPGLADSAPFDDGVGGAGSPDLARPADARGSDAFDSVGGEGDGPPGPPDGSTPSVDAFVPTFDGALPPREVFLTGHARAADGRTPVTVTAPRLNLQTQALPPDFAFSIGPVDAAAPFDLTFEAAAHQAESVRWDGGPDEPAVLEDDVYLYRGRRVSDDLAAERLFFSPDDAWLFWPQGETLSVSACAAPGAGRVLVAAEYELFLGLTPDGGSAIARRRNRPGLAGDVDAWPLLGGASAPLFQEAQPWVRFLDDRSLAMTHTQQALSRLVIAAPGGPVVDLAEGVPWLLVTRMRSGLVAYAREFAQGRFEVRLDPADGTPARTVNPDGAESGDAWLLTSPDARRLFWRTPEGELWVYDEDADTASRLAEDVLAAPRPNLQSDGGVYFWRGDVAAHNDLFLLPGGAEAGAPERRKAADVDGRTFFATADGFYVVSPGRGLFHGLKAGADEARLVLPGQAVNFNVSGGGVIALADGAAYTHFPGEAARDREADGLSQLEGAPLGATAWRAESGELSYIPGPAQPGLATVLSRGGAAPERVTEPSRQAIYLRDIGPWRREPLPAEEGEPGIAFDRETARPLPLTADRVLGVTAAAELLEFDPDTGASFEWARNVTLVERAQGRAFAAYLSDRGVFVVPLADAP